MKVKAILDEDFQDYKKPSMMIATCECDWKCLTEQGLDLSVCQNSELATTKDIFISINALIKRYEGNKITKAIVIAGLEPILQIDEVLTFIKRFREKYDDDIIIYTGYYPDEIHRHIDKLKTYKNIIVKFGRYIPNSAEKYDDVLGVKLASDNQFAVQIS